MRCRCSLNPTHQPASVLDCHALVGNNAGSALSRRTHSSIGACPRSSTARSNRGATNHRLTVGGRKRTPGGSKLTSPKESGSWYSVRSMAPSGIGVPSSASPCSESTLRTGGELRAGLADPDPLAPSGVSSPDNSDSESTRTSTGNDGGAAPAKSWPGYLAGSTGTQNNTRKRGEMTNQIFLALGTGAFLLEIKDNGGIAVRRKESSGGRGSGDAVKQRRLGTARATHDFCGLGLLWVFDVVPVELLVAAACRRAREKKKGEGGRWWEERRKMEAKKQAPKSQLNSPIWLCFDANKQDPARLVPGFFSHAVECPGTSNNASTWRIAERGEEKRESIAKKGVLIRTVRNLITRSRDQFAKEIAPFGHPTTTQKTPKKEMVHLGPPKNSLSGIKVSHGKESHASFQPLGNFGNLDNTGPPSNIEIVIEYCNRSPAPAPRLSTQVY
ncbi:hypothetical protein C8F04DRAFT_1200304 [Mycena alexandri]|uniref:Uncharacterized protein n=1 Tax=Mycena alexandri TaxID=1745969 RepID=A0AAD6S0A1_9AGAR|nr:hypothetical protein C8F04DRAFT_1200304 [Mycena alexandri]